jgi:NAD(P)-dependent dehydrogenase (short-subunit alcohol dehydrogenase family)
MKHVMISGCSRGLGKAMALGFHQTGWAVSGFARSRNAMDELESCGKERMEIHEANVTEEESISKFVAAAISRFGAPDFLINNAAMINANAPLWKIPQKDFDELMTVNLGGVHRMIRHVVPAMITAGHGVIVNISSGWGRSTSAEVAPYCASKWGIEGLSSALAQELPRGLAVIALNPGVIDTAMLRSCFGVDASLYPDPTEWAKIAVPFITKFGSQHNGKSLTVPLDMA